MTTRYFLRNYQWPPHQNWKNEILSSNIEIRRCQDSSVRMSFVTMHSNLQYNAVTCAIRIYVFAALTRQLLPPLDCPRSPFHLDISPWSQRLDLTKCNQKPPVSSIQSHVRTQASLQLQMERTELPWSQSRTPVQVEGYLWRGQTDGHKWRGRTDRQTLVKWTDRIVQGMTHVWFYFVITVYSTEADNDGGAKQMKPHTNVKFLHSSWLLFSSLSTPLLSPPLFYTIQCCSTLHCRARHCVTVNYATHISAVHHTLLQ